MLDLSLRAGETHAFRVALGAGQLLDLQVDQRGVDAVVTLSGPRGEPLLEVDNPNGADGTRGAERIVWIADTPGSYTVVIHGRAAASPEASYAIELEEPRMAEAIDRERGAAEKAKAEGDLLYGKRRPESLRLALNLYQDALAGFLALNDMPRQADTHYQLGKTWWALDEKERALEELEAALPLYQASGNQAQQAQCLHHLCAEHRSRNKLDSALDQCREALRLWEGVGDRLGTAATAHELGFVYRSLNMGHQALTLYDRALELGRELGRPRREAQTLHNRGRLYASLGQRQQAKADLEEALVMRRRLGNERDIAVTLNSLGLLHARRQEMGRARDYFAQALMHREAMGEHRVGIARLGLGWASLEADEAQSAEHFRQALELFRREGSRTWEAVALLFIGRQESTGGQLREVPDALNRALQLFEAHQELDSIAETRLAIAATLRRLGRLTEAQLEIEKALGMIEDLRNRVAASPDQRADFFATKQTYYEFYVDLLMERHDGRPLAGFDAKALEANERARARSLIEALGERDQGWRQKIDPVLLEEEQRLQRQIASKQLSIERRLAGETRLTGERTEEDRAAGLRREQRDLLRRYEKLQGQIRLQNPQYATLTQPPLPNVEEIQRLIGPETLLLEYRLGEQRSFRWAVTSDTVSAVELPTRERIEEAARFAVSFISKEREASATRSRLRAQRVLADLSRWLLSDLRGQLGAARRLIVVADGGLQLLPFEALALGGNASGLEPVDPLIASLDEIIYLPSASTLATLRGQLADREPAPRLLAVLADPVFTDDDPRNPRSSGSAPTPVPAPARSGRRSGGAAELERLVHTAHEAETILALVPTKDAFSAVGFDASRDVLTRGELSRHRIVHLATHGELNVEHGELSRLAFSLFDPEGGRREDGFLYAYEIYGLELPAELVVLSGCQTALGERVPGEGLVGLAQSFMHAGAARVVVSLWRVEDRVTAALMGLFYENLLVREMAPAEALRAAKSSIRQEKEWQDPYYWAAFVFHGEWRDFQK